MSLPPPLRTLLLIFSISLQTQVQAQSQSSCSTTSCTSACLIFDSSWNTCNYDYANKGFDSLTSCLCRWDGLQQTLSALGQCTVCQQDGLASNSLETYEYYAVICNTYLTEGEASAAYAVANIPSASVLAVFETTYLPVIQSGRCGGGQQSTTTALITTSGVDLNTQTSRGDDIPTTATTKVAGNSQSTNGVPTSSSPTNIPMSSGADERPSTPSLLFNTNWAIMLTLTKMTMTVLAGLTIPSLVGFMFD